MWDGNKSAYGLGNRYFLWSVMVENILDLVPFVDVVHGLIRH